MLLDFPIREWLEDIEKIPFSRDLSLMAGSILWYVGFSFLIATHEVNFPYLALLIYQSFCYYSRIVLGSFKLPVSELSCALRWHVQGHVYNERWCTEFDLNINIYIWRSFFFPLILSWNIENPFSSKIRLYNSLWWKKRKEKKKAVCNKRFAEAWERIKTKS